MKTIPLYAAIASLLSTIERCKKTGNDEWRDRHRDTLDTMLKEHLPSGSGIDRGSELLFDECKSNKLVFSADFHHMNDVGYYDGWSNHTVVVTPSLEHGAVLKITGRDRNDIKDYLHDVFHTTMFTPVDPYSYQKEIESTTSTD
jgi:hypothetical protein